MCEQAEACRHVPNRLRVLQHRVEPDELTAKRLAMLGATVLVLAHAVRDHHVTNNTVAGTLNPQQTKQEPMPCNISRHDATQACVLY